MTTDTTQPDHPAEWLPRTSTGHFKPGFTRCRECNGTGTVTTLVFADPNGEPDYDNTEQVAVECNRCNGRGAEHKDGCPRCGGDVVDHGIMPSSSHQIGCNDCGWTDLVG